MAIDASAMFGAVLRRHRLAAGLTQEALAERARLSARAISDLERGVRQRPYPVTVRLLAEALSLDAADRAMLEATARGRRPPATPALAHDALPSPVGHAGTPFLAGNAARQRTAGVSSALIGREEACATIGRAAAAARAGRGGMLLLTGEAGAGKTCLARHALAHAGLPVLEGGALEGITPPYGPLVAALRAYRRLATADPTASVSVAHAVAVLVPDPAGPPAPASRAALFDALVAALATIARQQPVAVFLDDLHWADSATLELLPALSGALEHEALLLICAYRGDEIPRGHPVRRLRHELRRAGRLCEIGVEPLDREQTGRLIAQVLGSAPGPALAEAIFDRTEGLPFFVEEMALSLDGHLRRGSSGLVLDAATELPLPESVRDAVLARTNGLSIEAWRALELASVAGLEFDVDLITAVAGGEEGLAELLAHGLIVERAPGLATFRHALSRDACYADVPWLRRRALHRELATRLEEWHASPSVIAEHWLAARDPERARPALLAAASTACRMHAHRDAIRALQRALDLWPEGADEAGRLDAIERLGECAELSGDLTGAARAWCAAADGWRRVGDVRRVATAERRLAGIYELQGDRDRALAARDAAAASFAAADLPGEAAAERLMAAAHLRWAGTFHGALALLDSARAEAECAGRRDLRARILGLEGNVRARLGEREGPEMARAGLALALADNLAGPATEIYLRLADALEHAGDYAAAQAAYAAAAEFCQTHQAPATAQSCRACLTVVLRLTGDWDRAEAICRAVLAAEDSPAHARAVAGGTLGSLHVLRGQTRRTRPLLLESAAIASRLDLVAMQLLSTWGLAMLDDLTGAREAGVARRRALLDRWERTEERHYVVPALHWAATFCAERNAAGEARACAAALSRIATATGQVDALAALAHALGEVALLDGDAGAAAAQFDHALTLLQEHALPFERVQSARRAGAAYLLAGRREVAIERLTSAYGTARRLGARPLAARIAQELAACGEPAPARVARVLKKVSAV